MRGVNVGANISKRIDQCKIKYEGRSKSVVV